MTTYLLPSYHDWLLPSLDTGWASSPDISDAPEQWDGLRWAMAPVLGVQGTSLADLSGNGASSSLAGFSLPADWVTSRPEGPALSFDGSNNVVTVSTTRLDNVVPFTYVWYGIVHNSGQSNFGVLFAKGGTGVGVKRWLMNNNSVELTVGRASVSAAGAIAAGTVQYGVPSIIVATMDADGNQLFYYNGLPAGSGGPGSGAFTSDSTSALYVGDWPQGGSSGSLNAYIFDMRVYDLVWDAARILNHAADPLALYRLRRRIWAVQIGTGQALVKFVIDDLNLTDSQTRNLALSRAVTENLDLEDNPLRNLALSRFVTNPLGLVDNSARNLTLRRFITENLNLQDSPQKLGILTRFVIDDLGLTDSSAKIIGFVRAVIDDLNLTDTASKVQGIVKVLTDSLSLQDSTQALRGLVRAVKDNLALADQPRRFLGMVRHITNTLNLSDQPRRALSLIRVIIDDLDLTDTPRRTLGFVRSVIDDLNLSDQSQRILGFVRSVIDDLNLASLVSFTKTAVSATTRFYKKWIKGFRSGGTS